MSFLRYCPSTPTKNVEWRLKLRKAAATDRYVQSCLKQACSDDVLFFFNFVGWMQEPRVKIKVRPFVTWVHQNPVILAMVKAVMDSESLEKSIDVTLEKSRDQGATWICIWILVWLWLNNPSFGAGLVTRNEGLVDSVDNKDALLYKFNWALEMLPTWMLPKGFDFNKNRSLNNHTIYNPENNACVTGYATTGDVGSGGRQTVFFMDEFAKVKAGDDNAAVNSTQYVTRCRWFVSTYLGDSNAFYRCVNDPNNAVKLQLRWQDNPQCNDLLYTFREGRPMCIQVGDQRRLEAYIAENSSKIGLLKRRGFVKEGKMRSPWYDEECLRPDATPRSIAQELDCNPRGSVGKVVSTEILDAMRLKNVCAPTWEGTPVFDEALNLTGLIEQEFGPLKLWFKPGINNSVPAGGYTIGCDISAGLGTASNSTIEGVNNYTGEQVLEYAVDNIQPTPFARIAIGIAKWLHGAMLNWETTGPTGGAFGIEVMDNFYYGNVFYREVEQLGTGKKTKSPGWANNSEASKAIILEAMALAMDEGKFIPHSEDLIREIGEYEWEDGKVIHKPTKVRGEDAKSHGDRAIGAGVCWVAVDRNRSKSLDINEGIANNPPYGSMAYRKKQAEEAERKREEADEFEDFTLSDLLTESNSREFSWQNQ